MPVIKLSDPFGLDLNAVPNPRSGIAKYAKEAVEAVARGSDLSKISALTLSDPAVTSVRAGLDFQQPVPLRAGDAALTIGAGLSGTLGIFVPRYDPDVLFPADAYGENVDVPAKERYVSIGMTATAGVEASGFGFSVKPGVSVELVNYRKFSTEPSPPSIAAAVEATLKDFAIPTGPDDLADLPPDVIVTLNGRGSLRFSATANLLAVSNPLATVGFPGGSGELGIKAGGAVDVSAGFEILCEYQVRLDRLESGKVRMGFYKRRGTEATVGVTASGGADAAVGGFDLYSTLIGALSSNPELDREALDKAGLPRDQVDAVEDAVKAGIQRKLELAVGAELADARSRQAAFLYEIEVAALDAQGREAVQRAFRGDVSMLETAAAPGITVVRSISSAVHDQSIQLTVNLIGIYNFISLSSLTLAGKVVYEPTTGNLVVADTASAERIQAANVPLRAVPQHLRKVLAESFFITAAYRGGKTTGANPTLTCAHTFFDLNAKTDRSQMEDGLNVAMALGLLSQADEHALLGDSDDFGSTAIYAETRYGDAAAAALFLDGERPRGVEEYERVGRETIQLLVRQGAFDEYRRQPAIDDSLWARMKAAGQANFRGLFPRLNQVQVEVIASDYSVIVWWAQTMSDTAARLLAVREYVNAHPDVNWDDVTFAGLRRNLAAQLKQVAADTKEEFGLPWGLISMDRASGGVAAASMQVSGSRVSLLRNRATLPGAVRVAGAP
jgi:hypothetical protein